MIAKVYSTIPCGYDGQLVEVEGDTNQGLPSFNIVGMANKTVNEARERVRSALMNSGFRFPRKKVTVNLAPAELTKNGSHLDLPIALAVLIISHQLLPGDVAGRIFVGELSLSGESKPIRGIINIVEAAKQAGYHQIFLPIDNLWQARLVKGIELIGVKNLRELFLQLKGQRPILSDTQSASQISNPPPDSSETPEPSDLSCTLDSIYGQPVAKRAITLAIAGHHNILLSGPPGVGKSLLARAAVHLLPDPTPAEQIEIAKINSLTSSTQTLPIKRPFRAPHHTASVAALLGGGTSLSPGEISLAHHGVLFLDELPEFARNALEALRQPLEDHQISLAHANFRVTYPANFILFATMNPCPCGFYGDPTHECTCQPRQLQNYRAHLSEPIMDRIDLYTEVGRVPSAQLLASTTKHSEHETAKTRILKALNRQFARYQKNRSQPLYNGLLTPAEVKKFLQLTPDAENLLKTAADRLALSARTYFKTIKLAQTIADLDDVPEIGVDQISEALSYRQRTT